MRAEKILALIALCAAALTASAQGYPSKPIRIVVGFPPGGGNDIVARLVGDTSEHLSRTIRSEIARYGPVVKATNIRAD